MKEEEELRKKVEVLKRNQKAHVEDLKLQIGLEIDLDSVLAVGPN